MSVTHPQGISFLVVEFTSLNASLIFSIIDAFYIWNLYFLYMNLHFIYTFSYMFHKAQPHI